MTLTDLAQTDEEGAAPASSLSVAGLVLGQALDGKYLIEQRLAEGGMGVVLRATHLGLDCPVAIKVMRAEHVANDDVVARLLAEARIAACLRSKHINRVLDVGRTPAGVPYLVLEYMQGSDLAHYLGQRGPLPIRELCDYVLQACEALAEAHALGIVHRDLKPENLFLSEEADGEFVLKILDFGISKAPASRRGGRQLTNPFEVVGSPTYMAPEQIRGGAVDERTDVWALGTVLYELATGNLLFGGGSVAETFSRIVDDNEPVPPLPALEGAERLHGVVCRCLRRDPDERFQNVVELARALGPLGSDPLQAARVGRVASAAQARAHRTYHSAPVVTPSPWCAASSGRTSDLGLATVVTPVMRRRPSWGRYGLFAGSVLLPLLGTVGYAAHGSAPRLVGAPVVVAPAPVSEAPAPVSVAPARLETPRFVAEVQPPVLAAVVPAAASAAAPSAARVSRSPAAVRAGRVVPRPAARPQPSVSVDAPATDAWDPHNFGGRR